MLGRLNDLNCFTQNAIKFLYDSVEIATEHPVETAIGTFTGLMGGAAFSLVYLSSEPAEQRQMILVALENIRITYNCAVSLNSEIRNVEFKCDDIFIQDKAQEEAKKVIDNVKGTELVEVGTGFAIALGSIISGGVLGFFTTTTALKVKEDLAARAAERLETEKAERLEAGLRRSKRN